MTNKAHKLARDIAYALLTMDILYYICYTASVTRMLRYNPTWMQPAGMYCYVFYVGFSSTLYNSCSLKNAMDMVYMDYIHTYPDGRRYYKNQTC